MPPQAVEILLNYCEPTVARFQQASNTRLLEIKCRFSQGQSKVESHCGDFQNFLISPEDLAV